MLDSKVVKYITRLFALPNHTYVYALKYTEIFSHRVADAVNNSRNLYLAEAHKELKIFFLWKSSVLLILGYNNLGLNYGECVLQQAGLKFLNTSTGLHIVICYLSISSFFITWMNMNMSCKEANKVLLFGKW